ncbi:MAG: LL-diaminopimelate aminotransferase [Oscillospiraceae bacterium]
MQISEYFSNPRSPYLFADIARRVSVFKGQNPSCELLDMGIGDVTLPMSKTVVDALARAAAEMGSNDGFRGYAPCAGYDFLKDAICAAKYKNTAITPCDIFVCHGAKEALGAVTRLFAAGSRVILTEPVYPAYRDVNEMRGNTVLCASTGREAEFIAAPPPFSADVVYLCSPNNPTGTAYTRAELEKWVDYANKCGALIIFDAAYEAYITDSRCLHSIFEIPKAELCAIEIGSLSKSAGFTGMRCGWLAVSPKLVRGDGLSLKDLWSFTEASHSNGVAYIIQRAAEAALSDTGLAQTSAQVSYYRKNAELLAKALRSLGVYCTGATNAPYVWFECKKNKSSLETFDELLCAFSLVCTPGVGFGAGGEGFCRLSGFCTCDTAKKAAAALCEYFRP